MAGIQFRSPIVTRPSDTNPYLSTATWAAGLSKGFASGHEDIRDGSPDYHKMVQSGLLGRFSEDVAIEKARLNEWSARMSSVERRKQAKEQADRMAEQGKANQQQGWLSAGASVLKAVAPLALAAATGGASIPFTAGLSAASGAASMFTA